jgi:prepilin-type N-terminal cleavage/methylation domain-containing protein
MAFTRVASSSVPASFTIWSGRPGFSLAELLAVLALTGLLAALMFGVLAMQIRVARQVAARTATTDAVRLTIHVLGGETRRMVPADVRALAAESLAVRAFRGVALVCPATGDHVFVRYRGDRAPDPRKDSALVVTPGREPTVVAMTDARRASGMAPCVARAGEEVLRLTVPAPVDDAAAMLVFETGSYYLSARALRYRLGSEGRQPLTPELFLHPETRFHAGDGRSVALTLRTAGGDTLPVRVRFGSPR